MRSGPKSSPQGCLLHFFSDCFFFTVIFKNMRGKQCYKTKQNFFLVVFKLVSQQRCSLLDTKRILSLSFLLIHLGKIETKPKTWMWCLLPLHHLLLPFSSSNSNPMKPKPHLCLLCSVIGCWHLYLPIRNNLGPGSHSCSLWVNQVLGPTLSIIIIIIIFWLLLFFETGFLCVALAVLELTLWTRLASNSEIRLLLPPKCWD